ncbi:hypothetical protein ACFFRR_006610 [Megaselia abdita]
MISYIKSKIAVLKNPTTAKLEPNFVHLEKTVLRVMGVSMFDDKKGIAILSPMLFMAYAMGITAFVFGLHEFLTVSTGLANTMQSAFIFFASINLMSMWFFLLKKYQVFKDVVKRVIIMSKITDETPKERPVGLKSRRFANFMQAALMIIYFMSPFTYNIHMLITWLFTGQRGLPVHIPIIGVPFDTIPGYMINLVWIWILMVFALGSFLSHDLSLFMTIAGIVGRFEVIKETYISKIGEKSSEYKTEAAQYELLKKIVRELNYIYDVIIDINEIYSSGLFSNFILGSLILCAGYTQLLMEPSGNALCIIPIYTLQLYFYSFFGELLVQKHFQVSTALYCSHWYNLKNTPSRTMFCFMLMRSQRPVGLQVGGFGILKAELFTAVNNKVYGVVTFVFNCLLD